MLNQVILVGRVVEFNSKGNNSYVIISVSKAFKNANGEYENDIIKCYLWNNISKNAIEYLKEGDVIGIKGRLQSSKNIIEVIAEKISFLSSKGE